MGRTRIVRLVNHTQYDRVPLIWNRSHDPARNQAEEVRCVRAVNSKPHTTHACTGLYDHVHMRMNTVNMSLWKSLYILMYMYRKLYIMSVYI